MKTRTARELRRGINFGTNWANGMLTAGGNKMLKDLLMQNIIIWEWRSSPAANKAATRAIRKARLRYQAASGR